MMNATPRYEVYREVFRVLEYRAGAIFQTESHGHHWVLEDSEPLGWIHAAPSDDFSKTHSTIRRYKGE